MLSPIPKPPRKPKSHKKTNSFSKKMFLDPLWLEARADWLDQHPPDLGEVFYQCALCPYPVHMDEVTLDHIVPRSRSSELKYDPANLQPSHATCNYLKGSMTMERWNKTQGRTVNELRDAA